MIEATRAYLDQGGWVMLPLIGVSLVMWTLIMERWQVLLGLQRADLDVPGVLAVCRGERSAPGRGGLRARLAAAFARQRTGRPRLDREILALESARLDHQLEMRHEAIGVLAAVAPLLGLLGTVLGMVETFQVISDFGTGNARALAGGISVALVTTQTGLLVAIPGLLVSNRLRRRAEQLRLLLAETTHLIDRDLARRDRERRTR
ncbi:MAG: MotA/TolQ/ExbB proton channel family protein [Candidatus Krumholzibacteriia bacterium]